MFEVLFVVRPCGLMYKDALGSHLIVHTCKKNLILCVCSFDSSRTSATQNTKTAFGFAVGFYATHISII